MAVVLIVVVKVAVEGWGFFFLETKGGGEAWTSGAEVDVSGINVAGRE